MEKLKKIVIIGPESTGKSTLSEQLAQHFNTYWCPEFAREYLLTHGKVYKYADLVNIGKGQIALEDEFAFSLQNKLSYSTEIAASNFLFIDTNLYVIKVWSEFVFNNCDPWILNNIAARKYDLYLLCNTDLPWINDELREYPDKAVRKKIYNIYEDLLINQHVPWVEISGSYEERLAIAIQAVNKYCLH
jgi:NadR type nicotinamide-nucleotide adenylyltransferase